MDRIGSADNTVTARPLATDSGTVSVKDFVKQLAVANRFVAQVTPFNENPITAIFDLIGFDVVAPQILEACQR